MKTSRHLPLVFATLPSLAFAVDPQSLDLHGLKLTPTLTVKESHDDNFRELEHDRDSSWITTIAPSLELVAEDRNSAYRLKYQANSEIYHEASDASNTDHDVSLESIMEFTARQRLHLTARYRKAEDTGSTAVSGENDKYHSSSIGGIYSFGAQSAANRLDFGASYEELRYDNSGTINADEERDTTNLNATWFHRIGGSSQALVEVRHNDFDYLLSNSPRNSTNDAVLVGAVWEATARTTGKLRTGYEWKNFDDDSRDDLESPMWEIGVEWAPRTYSKFNLSTRRAFDEGDDGSDAIKNTSSTLSWEHGWTERITSTLAYTLAKRDYEGQSRSDDLSSASAGVVYKMRRWLDVGLNYAHRDNDSDASNESFTRNTFTLSLTGSL